MKKALVLYSGGLDSRLVVRILLNKGFFVTALYFNLPFGCNCAENINTDYVKKQGAEFKLIDVKKEPYLSSYLKRIQSAKYGYGTGYNPCADCKVWMFKIAKKIFDDENFDVFATGEVLDQRPMSQTEHKRRKIDAELDFDVLRPLCAKNLPETVYEKKGLVNREELYDIRGRRRVKQMELAQEFGIDYPSPGGGCLLCEKMYKKRFDYLINNHLINENNLTLVRVGRMFVINDVLFCVSRNEKEGEILEKFDTKILGNVGKPTVYFNSLKGKENALNLQKAFSTGVNLEEREKFNEFKL